MLIFIFDLFILPWLCLTGIHKLINAILPIIWPHPMTQIDRDSYVSYFTKTLLVSYYKYGNLVSLRHPLTIAVTDFANLDKLTNDLLILNF